MLRIVLPLLLAGLLALACDSSPMYAPGDQPDPVDSNPAPFDTTNGCDEAEQIAVWFSGELTAPWQLRKRVRDDLEAIRDNWHRSVPQVAIEFFPPWPVSHVSAGVTGTVHAAIKAGSYSAWDSLNELYNLESVDTGRCYGSSCWIGLQFADCQNSIRLVAAYDTLPGFTYCEVSGWGGDWPMLLCHEVEDRMIYFFRDAWGDCPAGCISETYDIFTSADGTIIYEGFFDDNEPMPDPWAAWFAEAKDHYYGRDTWSSDDLPPDADWPVHQP